MTGIEQALGQPWSQRLGFSLVHFLWQGLVVAALWALAMTALRRRSANLRYAAACMAMLLMAAAPVVTFCIMPAGASRDAPAGPAGQEAPDVAMAAGENTPPVAALGPSDTPAPDSAADAAPAEAPAEEAPSAAAIGWVGRASRFVQPALPWMVAVWVAGVALLAIWHIGGWVGLLRLKHSALPLGQAGPDAQCAQAARRIAKQLGFSRAIRLLKSARIAGPVAVGVLRPAVLMPVTMLTGLSAPHIEAILAHEIAHLRRYDYLVNLLQGLVETVLFYHPAVWWVSGRIRVERENCCDDVAVGVRGDRTTYVTALASLAGSSAGVPRARPPGLAAAKRLAPGASFSVLARIRRLLGLPDSNADRANRWLAGVLIVVSLAVAGAFLCTNTDTTVAATAPAEAEDEATTKPADPEVTVERTKRKRGYVGRVLDHTGKPVVGADVFLVSRQGRLRLVGGKPGHFTGSSGKTDKDGRFKLLTAAERTTHVVVSCTSLHAWATRIAKADGEIRIKLPAPATVVLKYDIPGAATNRFRLALVTWETPQWKGIFIADTTDEVAHKPHVAQGGTATLTSLTPGVYDVGRYVTTRVGDLRVTKLCDRRWIELKSGETTRINFVRKTGVAIVGDIPGLAANRCDGAFISIEETTVRPGPHSNMGPTILDFLACGPDGKFKTSRIAPGRYNVTVEAHVSGDPSGPLHTGEPAPGFLGSAEVTVPAAGEPARLWIPMKPRRRPHIPAKAPEAPATAAGWERCWREMAGPGYTQASGAAAALGVGGDEAAKFLAGKLLIPPADPARIKPLVAHLGSPRHKVREKAQADLKALDMAALPGLRAAAKGDLSAEARTRIKALLAREPVLLMRMERAIDVLAKLDRSRCLQVLRKLASRDPGAPETRLAKAKLQALLSEPANPATTQPAKAENVAEYFARTQEVDTLTGAGRI